MGNRLTILIVDDVAINREILKDIFKDEYKVVEAEDGLGALEVLRGEEHVDIILLDIIMPLLNGMDVAREIRESDRNTKIVFLTSSSEFAIESYDVKASGYILKPVSYEKLCAVLNDCVESVNEKPDSITIRTASGYQNIYLHQIECVEAQNKKVVFTLGNGSIHEAYGTLSSFEKILDCEKGFFKCHRSYLVYLPNVDHFSMTEIITKSGRSIPIARGYGKAFKEAYFAFVFRD